MKIDPKIANAIADAMAEAANKITGAKSPTPECVPAASAVFTTAIHAAFCPIATQEQVNDFQGRIYAVVTSWADEVIKAALQTGHGSPIDDDDEILYHPSRQEKAK